MGREVGGRFKKEGIYAYLWLIHVDVWQKPTKFCNAIILQLKNKLIFKILPVKKKKKDQKNPHNWNYMIQSYILLIYEELTLISSLFQ